MRVGMLVFNDKKGRTLEDKVRWASNHYFEKYQLLPNKCYVHPAMLVDGQDTKVDNIVVKGSNSILPHHIWIGLAD